MRFEVFFIFGGAVLLIIVLAVVLIRTLSKAPKQAKRDDVTPSATPEPTDDSSMSAEEILIGRLARGEISADEYKEIKEALDQSY